MAKPKLDMYVARRFADVTFPTDVDTWAPCFYCREQVALNVKRYEEAVKDFNDPNLKIVCLECATEIATKNNWEIV